MYCLSWLPHQEPHSSFHVHRYLCPLKRLQHNCALLPEFWFDLSLIKKIFKNMKVVLSASDEARLLFVHTHIYRWNFRESNVDFFFRQNFSTCITNFRRKEWEKRNDTSERWGSRIRGRAVSVEPAFVPRTHRGSLRKSSYVLFIHEEIRKSVPTDVKCSHSVINWRIGSCVRLQPSLEFNCRPDFVCDEVESG